MVSIRENILLSRTSGKIFQDILMSMRRELDEHREVINENTNEIQTNFQFLCELDKRIDVIQERIDELSLLVKGNPQIRKYTISPLSSREKAVFLSVLSLTESFSNVTYAQIGKQVGLSSTIIGSYISRMQDKGVPFVKKIHSGIIRVGIEKEFRETQIRKNLVGLEVPLTHWY